MLVNTFAYGLCVGCDKSVSCKRIGTHTRIVSLFFFFFFFVSLIDETVSHARNTRDERFVPRFSFFITFFFTVKSRSRFVSTSIGNVYAIEHTTLRSV